MPLRTTSDVQYLLAAARAEEEAIDSLFSQPVLEVTLRTGTESLTVAVSPEAGWAVVHELSVAAAHKLQSIAQQLHPVA